MLKHLRLALALSAGLLLCAPAFAQTIQVKDAHGNTITLPIVPSVGQKTTALSLPVTLPSDMAPISVVPSLASGAPTASVQAQILAALNAANGYLATIAANSANFGSGSGSGSGSGAAGSATAANQTTANNSLATLVSQTVGLATAALQGTGNSSLASLVAQTVGLATSAAQTAAQTTLNAIAASTAASATATGQAATNTALGTANTTLMAISNARPASLNSVFSAAAESSHVLKSSAGVLWSWAVTSGATAGFVMIFDATTAPADGAVTPKVCVPLGANSVIAGNAGGDPPETYTTGIVVVFSTGANCFTKTASTAFFIKGRVQ